MLVIEGGPAVAPEARLSENTQLPRRSFLQRVALVAAAVAGSGAILKSQRLFALAGAGPDDPEIPNEAVAKIYRERFGGRTITRGHVELDMPAVAEDGRIVPVIIESPLPMRPDNYVKAVHLIVDHNPDPHLAAYHLTPAIGSVAIQTRIKMKRTTWVRAILETSSGDVWAAYAHVNVSLNGCG